MKFGKQLELTANVQWRQYYVQYKKLKRLIKRVAFEVERGQRKQEKVEKMFKTQGIADLPRPPNVASYSSTESLSLTTSGMSKARVGQGEANESTPLLSPQTDLNLANIEDAKREFWEMTNANIAEANAFYRSKVTHLAKIVKDFESMLRDEDKATHGHVSSKPRTTSHEVDRGFAGIQDCYDTLIDLKQFVNLNHTGFRKIVKKFDKTTGASTLDTFIKQLNHEDFYSSNDIDALLDRLFAMTSKYADLGRCCLAALTWLEGPRVTRLLVEKEVQQRCLAMLVFITSLWVSEALPYFATSLLVPVLVVFLRILNDKQHPTNLLDASTDGHSACWFFLLWAFNPADVKYIPQIVYDQKQRVNQVHVAVVLLTVSTIVLWALFTFIAPTVGDMSIISLILMVTLFGTGILSQFDFNSFSWHILFLIGGGSVLGETLSHSLIQALPSGSVWLTTLLLCMLVLGLTTFISHTVASLILLPIIVQLSIEVGQPHIPVISCALAISAAMGLPFASFPNINSLLVLDDHGEPYLEVQDFLKVGLVFSLFTVALIVSL
ncbi:hypothetical protein DYB32_001236, partial [Aphanomyces invadans]